MLCDPEVRARRHTPATRRPAFIPKLMTPGIAKIGADDDPSFEGNILDAAKKPMTTMIM